MKNEKALKDLVKNKKKSRGIASLSRIYSMRRYWKKNNKKILEKEK